MEEEIEESLVEKRKLKEKEEKKIKESGENRTISEEEPVNYNISTSTSKLNDEGQSFGNWFTERSRYIPLRLTRRERKLLRLLEAALNVSEYTDKVDILSYKNKAKRIHAQIKIVCAILSGLLVGSDYRAGVELVVDRNFADNAEFFQEVFEIGRRHKIMNPG